MATKELVTGGTAMWARLSKAARRAFPGPWGVWPVVGETLGALAVVGFGVLFALVGHQGTPRTVLSATAVLLLFALRRGPAVPVLLVTAAGAGAIDSFTPLVVFAAWSAGYRVARVLPVAGAMGGAFVLMMTTALRHGDETVPAKGVMGVTLAGFLVFAVLPALAGRYLAQRRALLTALHERNEQLVREQAMIAHQARLRERHRIAQDMHDSLGHRLALISVHSGALEVDRTLTGPQREAVGVLRQASVAAMRELREVVGVLHEDAPPAGGAAGAVVAGHPGTGGGLDGIDGLAEGSRAAGAAVELSRSGDSRPLPAAAGQAAYRIVQEALTNVHKHATGAPITLALRYEPDALVVEVANGPAPERTGGAPAVSGGQGLTGLRERARLVGGMVHAGPTPDGGWRLAAVLPYQHDPRQGPRSDDAPALPAGAGRAGAPPQRTGSPLRRRSPVLGCAVGAVLVVVTVLGLIGWGVVGFVQELDRATVDRKTYEAVELGSPEAEVRSKLPVGSRFLTDDYRGTGPTPPDGASCLWFVSDDPGGDNGIEVEWVARFCFKDGRLTDKQHYRAKV